MNIICRSHTSAACYHGRPCFDVYGEDGMEDDGTFDGASVICDPCYIAIGQPVILPVTRRAMSPEERETLDVAVKAIMEAEPVYGWAYPAGQAPSGWRYRFGRSTRECVFERIVTFSESGEILADSGEYDVDRT